MFVVDKYIDYVKQEAVQHPEKSWDKILLGFKANKWRTRLLSQPKDFQGIPKTGNYDDEPWWRIP